MPNLRSALRAVLPLVAALIVTALATPNAALASVPYPQRFSADSGDSCRYGQATGQLAWRLTPGSPVAVEITGILTDRPVPSDPVAKCLDDRRYSTVSFTAYAGNVVVDQAVRQADNGTTEYTLTLGPNSTTSRIDRLVVLVCRPPLFGTGPVYCGPAQTYSPLSATPTA